MTTPIVLVLKFRDLVSPQGGRTIDAHREIIKANGRGYVWWAWWKRQNEGVNYALWDELSRQISSSGGSAPAFLLDSGERKLYRTTIQELRSQVGAENIEAPEGGQATPNYYNKERYATWFKLGEIKDADPTEIRNYAYRAIPHDDLVYFDRAAFENRQVASIQQLLQFGNITYWILTPKTSATRPALDAPISERLPPAIAPRDVLRAESSRILHISDLHLSETKHAYPAERGDAHNLTMADAIFQSLGNKNLPGLVIVTGDLTWTGSRPEFEFAFKSLDDLRSKLGLSRQHFVIIPGNHDIQWAPASDGKAEYDWQKPVPMTPVTGPNAKRNYVEFFQSWYQTEPNDWLSVGRRFFLVGGPTLDVLGLNSSELQQFEGSFAGMGRITTEAFNKSAESLEWRPDGPRPAEFRIVCTHHHVAPVISVERPKDAIRGFGIALDAEAQLLRATEFGVDLIMHGHQHQPYLGMIHRQRISGEAFTRKAPLLIVGSGSTGVVDAELGPINHRSFNLIDLSRDGMIVKLYATTEDGREFKKFTENQCIHGQPWERLP